MSQATLDILTAEELDKRINCAYHALRSYQFGNSSEELAKIAADGLEPFLFHEVPTSE